MAEYAEIHGFLDEKIGSGKWHIKDVLNALGEIAGDTAEHIRVNWQDYELALTWDALAEEIDKGASFAEQYIP